MTIKEKVVGIGAGGHAKVVIDALAGREDIEVVGLLDPRVDLQGQTVAGIPVLGGDELLPALQGAGVTSCFIAIGGAGDNRPRQAAFEKATALGLGVIQVVHPRAMVAKTAKLGRGTVVMAGAVVNCAAHLGDNVIVNTGAIVEHDCWIDDHVHVAPRVVLGGNVRIGEGTHLGLGCIVLQGCKIGRWVLVGAGAVVHRDLPDGVKAIGVPAQVVGREEGGRG